MEQVYTPERTVPEITLPWMEIAVSLLTLIFITVFVALSLYRQKPPEAVPASAPATEFSSERAMTHLRAIAQKPHPIGSSEHARVRDLIVSELTALGVEPQVQRTAVVNPDRGTPFRAGTVENVLARLKGTDSSQAVLLVAHYDSMPTSLGASDDGAAVVALLETLRALQAGERLKNDIIFLFTDGEEVGLLGAKAFVAEHPWAKDVGVVLNFEARGTGGPSFMFETSNGNGKLIRGLSRASADPFATSLSYEIYRRLPNDTDFTVFKKAGYAGLNFAFIDGLAHYHTYLDNISDTDERSLQHQGLYALSLARQFGSADLSSPRTGNSVYFNLLGSTLIHYPGALVLPLSALVTLLFIGVVVLGFIRKQLKVSGMVLGFFAFLLATVASAAGVTFAWRGIEALHRGVLSGGYDYNGDLYFVGFVALAIALTCSLLLWFRRRVSVEDLTVGGLFWWLLLTWGATLLMPGASYLFQWPLCFTLLGVAYMFASGRLAAPSLMRWAVFSTCAVVGIILLTPTIKSIYMAFTMEMAGALMVLVVLTLALFVPQLQWLSAPKKWLLPGALTALGLFCIVTASLTAGFDKNHPKQNNVFYVLNADSGKAEWASWDGRPDAWTAQFFNGQVKRGPLDEYLPLKYKAFLQSPAKAAPLTAPNVVVVEDFTRDGIRTTRMNITSPRQAPIISVYLTPEVEVLTALVDGKELKQEEMSRRVNADNPWSLQYWAVPAAGLELTLQTKSSQPLKLRVADQSYGLPDIPNTSYKPRPESMIPAPAPNSETTIVSKSFTF